MKPRAALDDQLDAVLRRGRRDQINDAQAGVAHYCLVVFRFLRRQIEHEQAVHAGARGLIDEFFNAVTVNAG